MNTGKILYGTDIDLSRFKWTEEDIDLFSKKLEIITSFLNKQITEENFEDLVNHFYLLVGKIPLPLIPVDSNFIVRARANYNGEVFKEEWQLTYNSRNTNIINLGRFNRPKEGMFYGAVPANVKQGILIGTVSLECCKDLVAENDSLARQQYFTFGKFYLREQFHVLNLCFNDRVLQVNRNLRKRVEKYFEEIESTMPSSSVAFVKSYWRFLSDMASKKQETSQHHFITTAFMCAVREYYKEGFNGIVYPSSMTENEGVNIVLTPTASDKYLELKQVFMYKYTRDPDNTASFHSGICSQIAEVINGRFSILGIC